MSIDLRFVNFAAIKQSEVVPPCYKLPDDFESLLSAADAQGADGKWLFKPMNDSKPNMLLQPTNMRDFNKIKA